MTGRVIIGKGISEPTGPACILGRANWSGLEVDWLDWEASYAVVNPDHTPFGPSFMASIADGVHKTFASLDVAPSVLAVYSGANALAHAVLEAGGHPNLRGVAFLADPYMPALQPRPLLTGVAGARRVSTSVPVQWWSCEHDVICQAPADSPVRTFADQSEAFSLIDPVAWGEDMIDRLRRHRWQAIMTNPLDPVGAFRRYSAAVGGVADYLGLAGHIPSHQSYDLRIPSQPWTFAVDEIAAWTRGVLA